MLSADISKAMGRSIAAKNIIIAIAIVAASISSHASSAQQWTYARIHRFKDSGDAAVYLNDSATNSVSVKTRAENISTVKLQDNSAIFWFENLSSGEGPSEIRMVTFDTIKGTEFSFTFNAKSRSFILSRIENVPRMWHLDGSGDLDDYSGSETKAKISPNLTTLPGASFPKCDDSKGISSQAVTLQAATSLVDFNSKVDDSCSDKQRSVIASAASAVNDSPDSGPFLGCVRKNVGRNFAGMLSALLQRPSSGKMFFCDSRTKTQADVKAQTMTFGLDYNTRDSLNSVMFHEVLHLSGCNDNETSMLEKCCVADSAPGRCAAVQATVKNQDRFCKSKSVGDTQSVDIVDDSAAAIALAKEEIYSPVKRDSQALNSAGAHLALPNKMTVSVESADQIKAMKPALAKYKESANVLRKQVAKTIDRMPSLIPTAYAGNGTQSRSKSGDSYVVEPVAFNANGPVLELPNGELAQVSIPFSQQKGFGEMKVTTVSKASLTQFNAPSGKAFGGPASNESGSSQSDSAARAPSGGEAAAYSAKSSSNSASAESSLASAGSSVAPTATASAAPSSSRRPRNAGGGTFADSAASQTNYSFRSWDDAWSTLKRSKDPVKILESSAFQSQEFDASKKRKVSFQGKVYGPADAKRIINLDAYWNPE